MMTTGYDFEKDKQSPTDLCINCGRDTGIPKITPVYVRELFPGIYVEGAGQLCEKCDRDIYIHR